MKIGVIGAGLLGTACMQRLIGAGIEVLAYDVDAAKRAAAEKLGATSAGSIAEVAKACSTLVLAVFNTDQVEEVVEGRGGIAESTAGGESRVVICMSTCDPDRLAAVAGRAGSRNVRLLEVPLSGTSRQVAEGAGVGLVGGFACAAANSAELIHLNVNLALALPLSGMGVTYALAAVAGTLRYR